jgi:MoaA/NifB/PqqE/SkfB family radical SAM enzyme
MKNDFAFTNLVHAIEYCHKSNTPVLFNTCLSKADYTNGGFEDLLELARDMGGSIIQLIKPKGAGGWLLEGSDHFSPADLQLIKDKVIRYNTDKKYRSYPFISAMIIDEDEEHFGCTAGGTDRFYLNAKGDLQACEFLNLSFGNIAEEPVEEIYERMRRSFPVPGCNWLCELYQEKIVEYFTKNENKILPLPYSVTKDIINSERHGEVPDFYKRANKI